MRHSAVIVRKKSIHNPLDKKHCLQRNGNAELLLKHTLHEVITGGCCSGGDH